MPAPAVYVVVAVIGVVAVGFAFKELVYEPHIAPQVEAWAENFLARREQRRRRRQGPVSVQPVRAHGHETASRRSSNDTNDNSRGNDMSIELEELAARERAERRHQTSLFGLRRRRPVVGSLEQSDVHISHPVMTPTHVIIDTSTPSSPGGQSIGTSALDSLENSPAHPTVALSDNQRMIPSPRLPTPMSLYSSSPPSSRAMTPTTVHSERSLLSSGRATPDVSAPQALTSAYNTPLDGSVLSEGGRVPIDLHSVSGSRVQSPFSDIFAVDAHSPEPVGMTPSAVHSPQVRSPSLASDLTLSSDDEFDVLSPRSGIFSPPSRAEDDPFEVLSQHGSDVSWTSVGRRSPT